MTYNKPSNLMVICSRQPNNVFTGGETPQPEPSGPVAMARSFLEHRAAGVKAHVESTVVLSKGVSAFANNLGRLQQFLQLLFEANVLSQDERDAILRRQTPAIISKLRKIEAYKAVILYYRILYRLSGGYSVLYALVLLYEAIPLVHRTPDVLADILRTCPGQITRIWLEKKRAALEEKSPAPDASEDVTGTIKALLLTPSEADIDCLRNNKRMALPKVWRTLSKQIDESAILFVHARLDDQLSKPLSVAVEQLGFDFCNRTYLMVQPASPDVAGQSIMSVYERGNNDIAPMFSEWSARSDPVVIAEKMLSHVEGRRVHLCAPSLHEGWESLVGSDNWR